MTRDINARLDRAAEGARAADRVIARIDEREGINEELTDCPICGTPVLRLEWCFRCNCDMCAGCVTRHEDENENLNIVSNGVEGHAASERAECSQVTASGAVSADNGGASMALNVEAPHYDGNLLPAMTAMVTGFVDKLAKFYSPCPQGDDCAGDGKHNRLFACDHCSFVGCCACMDAHEAEAHWTDSDTAREMHS